MPARMLVLELTSSTAAIIAGLADLPMTESKGNKAPNFTTFGLEEIELIGVVEGPVLPTTSKGIHKQKTKRNNVLLITMLPEGFHFDKKAKQKAPNSQLQFFIACLVPQ